MSIGGLRVGVRCSYLASENIKRKTSAKEVKEEREGMEEMSEVYREKGEKLHLPVSETSR